MTKTRVNVTLSADALDALREIAQQRNLALLEVLRQAIGHEKFLSEETRKGNRVIIESSDASDRRELVITQ